MKIQAVRGMHDTLPGEIETWQLVEFLARRVFDAYGFSEIRIPLLERTELFARSIGEATDIVEKEMYTFLDRNEVSLTLRPEATAGILRAYIEHNLHRIEPLQKLYCIGPMFRHERPQKGRYRQFHQIDAEILASADPRSDAELLAMLRTFFHELGLKELDFQINSLGCGICRPGFKESLMKFLGVREKELCEDCQRRLRVSPLRIFDCKVEKCQEVLHDAPRILDQLCPECQAHLQGVKIHLDLLRVPYSINSLIMRGLDYYTRTTFEVISQDLGAQNAVCGGGRYDRLIQDLGGPDLPGIGFAIGVERLVHILREKDAGSARSPDCFVVALGQEAAREAFLLVERARQLGLRSEMDFRGGTLKAQMRRADKLGARRVIILGETELESRKVPLRDMREGTQEQVPVETLEDLMSQWANRG
jgi:histidyl-tRNA synthetase